MAIPIFVVIGVIVSAFTRLNAIILGQPVSVSALDLIALAIVLVLVAAILWLVRSLLRDLRDQRPRLAGGTA